MQKVAFQKPKGRISYRKRVHFTKKTEALLEINVKKKGLF